MWLTETVAAFKGWFNAPFQGPISVPQMFLILGAVIVSAAIWHSILHRLHGE